MLILRKNQQLDYKGSFSYLKNAAKFDAANQGYFKPTVPLELLLLLKSQL